jgi:hypothetical protein
MTLDLDELKGVKFECEVERSDGLPADKYLIEGIDDGRDHRSFDDKRKHSRYRPYVTEWDGHKKRVITIVRELGRITTPAHEGHDYRAAITEYC